MATGDTTTSALADSLPTVIAAARQVKEFEGRMSQLVDRKTLGGGTGLSWNEVELAALSAQSITETTELDNPQQLSDSLLTITPTVIGIQTFFSDRVRSRISSAAFAQTGSLAMNAMVRKKDEDGLTAIDGATTQMSASGQALQSTDIAASAFRITSNTTEPGPDPIYGVFHGFGIADIYNEITLSSGSAVPQSGEFSARVYQDGFRGRINNVAIFEDGNITVDSTPDAKGGVFSKMALVLVQGRGVRTEVRREPHKGGGGDSLFIYDEYAYGERSAGNWLFEVIHDATAPA